MIKQLAQRDSDWRKMAFKITKDKELADDIVQEMYIKSITFKTVTDGYIYTILRNIFYDSLKKKEKEVSLENFNTFEVINESETNKDYFISKEELNEILVNFEDYEKIIFNKCQELGQREFSRRSQIPLITVHLIVKKIKKEIKWQSQKILLQNQTK